MPVALGDPGHQDYGKHHEAGAEADCPGVAVPGGFDDEGVHRRGGVEVAATIQGADLETVSPGGQAL